MTITNLALIEDALRDINVISEVDSASSEQGSYALRKLNQMMELLKENDVDIGYFAQSSTDDNCPIPDWAELSITSLLTVALAPKYGATVSAELAAIVSSTAYTLTRKMISEKLDNANMDFMPIGSGQYGYGYDITKR